MDLSELTMQSFQPHIDSTFRVTLPDGQSMDMKLVSVARLMERVTSKRLKREPFAAYFQAPDAVFLQQGVYEFSHPELGGPAGIFIVPISREDGHFEYEAVFT